MTGSRRYKLFLLGLGFYGTGFVTIYALQIYSLMPINFNDELSLGFLLKITPYMPLVGLSFAYGVLETVRRFYTPPELKYRNGVVFMIGALGWTAFILALFLLFEIGLVLIYFIENHVWKLAGPR